jgi:predicted phage replisome organizer
MAEKDKKYYWLKLKRDFFKRHDIRIIEEMPNGKDYILFYLKLLLESIDHEGSLRFSDSIPYNEQMLSVVTNTNIDIVRSAMKIFIELNMMDILDDQTIFMTEVDKLIGCETKWAEKKRQYRLKGKSDNVLALSTSCPTDVRQEIDIDKEKELETEIEKEKEEINNKETNNTVSVDVDAVFKKMMGKLSQEIAPITYATFFDNQLKVEGVDRDRLLLSSESFMAQVIDEKYRDKVLAALREASNGQITDIRWVWEV